MDYLYCKDHFDKLTRDKKWLRQELDKGWSGYNRQRCELVRRKRCNKKGFAIVQFKNGKVIGCIKFNGEVI